LGFRVKGLGFRVKELGFRVRVWGFMISRLGAFRVWGEEDISCGRAL
jgi:hypothetical protein